MKKAITVGLSALLSSSLLSAAGDWRRINDSTIITTDSLDNPLQNSIAIDVCNPNVIMSRRSQWIENKYSLEPVLSYRVDKRPKTEIIVNVQNVNDGGMFNFPMTNDLVEGLIKGKRLYFRFLLPSNDYIYDSFSLMGFMKTYVDTDPYCFD